MAAKRLKPDARKTPLITTVRQTTRDKVERLADREGTSISEVARRALEQYVDKQGAGK